MNIRIVANPISGGGQGRTQALALQKELEALHFSAEVAFTEKAGDGGNLAADPGLDCVVAVGGDGTINEIINGLEPNTALSILPMGTANVVARELGYTRDPAHTAKAIADGNVLELDLIQMGERKIILGAGAGLDAAITETVSGSRGKKSSYLKWIMPTIKTAFAYSFPPIRVVVDGQEVSDSGQYVVVGNCRSSAGLFPATPQARMDDGFMDVCVFHRLSVLKMMTLAATVWNPNFVNRKDVIYLKGKAVRLESRDGESVPFQIDGDPGGQLPVTFEIAPQSIQVFIPSSNRKYV
jgi:YegS/Rv2252/BmrU family lipid kinase